MEVSVPWDFNQSYSVFQEFRTKVYKVALPSLSCCLSQLEFLALRIKKPLEIKDNGMVPELPRLKKLILLIDSLADDQSLLGLTSLLGASPKLEKFSLQLFFTFVMADANREVNMGTAKSSSHNCLKAVEFLGYFGCTSEFELIKYFLENCAALGRIKICPYHSYYEPPNFVESHLELWFDAFYKIREKVKKRLKGHVPDHIELTIHDIE